MRVISGSARGTKLYSLEGENTRPTLDRVKEPLFSILNFDIPDATVLDLFAGSGALGLEAISRGAKRAILCDKAIEAIHIIEKNVEKLKSNADIQIINKDYEKVLESLNEKIDIVFLDPPYMTNFAEIACQKIIQNDLLSEDGIIIIETDRKEEVVKNITELDLLDIFDERKYGRAELLFLRKK